MATAASISTGWTTCRICLEVYENPKSLPCLHGFCLKCLEQHFKDKCSGDEVPCPLCREEFAIPPNGLGGLKHHFFIQHLVDARNASSASTDETPCEMCLELRESGNFSEKLPAATMFCIDCRQKLCAQCSRVHMNLKGGPHQLRPLGAELEQELVQLQRSYCDKHNDELVKLYCYDCNENICVLCFAVKHMQHKTAEIPVAAKSFTHQIDSDDQQVLALVDNIRDKKDQKDKKLSDFIQQAGKVKSEIKAVENHLNDLVNNQVALQLSEVDVIQSESQKKAETVEERYQLALVAMESFHAYSRKLLDKGRSSDVTRAASELHKRATELLNNDVTSVQYDKPHVTFTPVDMNQLKHLNLIGKVTASTGNQSGTSHFANTL